MGVSAARAVGPDDGEPTEPIDLAFRALSDPVRRRAVELLAAGPQRSGELAESLGLTPSAMSKHLRVLRHGGMVDEQSDGIDARVRIYTLRSASLAELRDWMARTEQGWVTQLSSLKEHVEGASGRGSGD